MLFGVHVGQIITWQVAVLAVLLVLQQPQRTLISVGVLALLLLILTMVPVHGRWLFQWLGLWIRFTARRRHARLPDTEDGALTVLLRTVTRGGQIATLDINGTSMALITHAGGVTAVVSVTPADNGLISESGEVILPLSDLLPPAEEGEPAVSAQIVLHTTPAPNVYIGDSAAAVSYRTLANGTVPSRRRCWVALQALRSADDHSEDALHAALTSAVQRLQRRLRKTGLRGHPLNESEVGSDLLELARVNTLRSGPAVVQERWRSWSAGGEVQTTFRIVDWPDLSTPYTRNFLNWLTALPTVATTVALAARRDGRELELEAAVRMTLPDVASLRPATMQLHGVAERAGARMRRLNGEQVFGVAASLPLGGFLS